jgi:hypothetical protein
VCPSTAKAVQGRCKTEPVATGRLQHEESDRQVDRGVGCEDTLMLISFRSRVLSPVSALLCVSKQHGRIPEKPGLSGCLGSSVSKHAVLERMRSVSRGGGSQREARLRGRPKRPGGVELPRNPFELLNETRYFSVITTRKEDLYRAREQEDTSQFVLAWLRQSRSN